MKLLLLNWLDRENPQAGGAELHLHETFGRLAKSGWQVTAVTSGWPAADARAEIDGMQFHRVGGRYSYALAAPHYARSLLARESFDLVVEDLNKVPLFSPLWSSVPTALLVHHLFGATGFQVAPLPLATATWLLERPVPRAYRGVPIVAVSQSTKDDLIRRGLDPASIQVVENGIDAVRYHPGAEEDRFPEPTLLYLGRLKKYKGVELLIDAVAGLRGEGLALRLLVAGDGDHRAFLERRARAMGLDPQSVRFLGFVSEEEKLRLLQQSWVHALTSVKEGWGLSVLEAGACATPTVASDSPGLRDSVVHGETGLLMRHGDVAALRAGLRRIVENAPLRKRMGKAARRFAQTFTWERTAAGMDRFLRGAVASTGPDR